MNETGKLYKCYKMSCNKCNDDENKYITEEEYRNLLDADGKIRCPEGHMDCGIQELKPEDYPKPPKNYKKVFFLAGAGLSILILAALIIVFSNSKDSNPKAKVKEVTQIDNEQAGNENVATQPEAANEVTKSLKVEETTPVTSGTQTKIYTNGNKYVGDFKNGIPDGVGTYYFKVQEQISKRDPQNRVGEPGDVLQGLWKEGYFVNGKLFDKQGTLKEVLILGTN